MHSVLQSVVSSCSSCLVRSQAHSANDKLSAMHRAKFSQIPSWISLKSNSTSCTKVQPVQQVTCAPADYNMKKLCALGFVLKDIVTDVEISLLLVPSHSNARKYCLVKHKLSPGNGMIADRTKEDDCCSCLLVCH